MPTHDLVLHVVDTLTGAALSGAEIECRIGNRSSSTPLRVVAGSPTDAEGETRVSVEESVDHLVVGALISGWTPRCVRWDPHRGDSIPKSYTLRLAPIERSAGGILRSPDGMPVAGAEVHLAFFSGGDHSDREPPREYTGTPGFSAKVVARSDAEGRWSTRLIPEQHPGFLLTAYHTDFAPTPICAARPSSGPWPDSTESPEATRLLWEGDLETVLGRASRVAGTVRDSSGILVADAEVILNPTRFQGERRTHTDAEGRFVMSGLPEGSHTTTVLARGFAPAFPDLLAHPEAPAAEVMLERSEALRLRVVDDSGAGIPGVLVVPTGFPRCHTVWDGTTDADGRVEWPDAPPHAPIPVYLGKPGWVEVRDREVLADGSEQVIVLKPAPRMQGRVVDAETGLPIATFKVVPRDKYDRLRRGETQYGHDGGFTIEVAFDMNSFRFRIEAKDYCPVVVGPLDPTQVSTAPIEIRLSWADPALAIHGWVLLPDGSPAVDVAVGLISADTRRSVGPRGFGSQASHLPDLRTDAAGAFRFPPEATGEVVVAVSNGGIGDARVAEPGQPLTLRLQAWGRIEGTVETSLRKKPVETVYLVPRVELLRSLLALAQHTASCDSEGRFVFPCVPPGTYAVHLGIHEDRWIRPHHQRPVTVPAGGTVHVQIAEQGPIVKGRLVVDSSGVPGTLVDWKDFKVTFAARDLPPPPGPLTRPPASAEERKRLQVETQRIHDLRSSILISSLDPNGCFQSPEGLAPGEYVLGIHWVPESTTIPGSGGATQGGMQDPMFRQLLTVSRLKQTTPFSSVPFQVSATNRSPENWEPMELGEIRVSLPQEGAGS